MMFKTLVLQTLYGLSDAPTEFQILDRRSFGRFLGLDDGDNTPDETMFGDFVRLWFGPRPSTPCLAGSTTISSRWAIVSGAVAPPCVCEVQRRVSAP